MGDNYDSVARRRELRKRKILENAESRKQKIFGINSCCKDTSSLNTKNSSFNELNSSKFTDDQDETASNKSMESEVSSKSLNIDGSVDSSADISRLNEIFRNIPDPLTDFAKNQMYKESEQVVHDNNHQDNPEIEETRYINNTASSNQNSDIFGTSSCHASNLHSLSGGSLLSNSNDKFLNSFDMTPSFLLVFLEHPASPCFLAIIVSLMLSYDLGNLVSNSLIIPFCIWEIQQIIGSYGTLEIKEESSTILEAALLLCGIKKNIITKYIWISKLMKDVLEDFAVYIVTIVIWQVLIGFSPIKIKD